MEFDKLCNTDELQYRPRYFVNITASVFVFHKMTPGGGICVKNDVASTSIRLCFDVMCLLGCDACYFSEHFMIVYKHE